MSPTVIIALLNLVFASSLGFVGLRRTTAPAFKIATSVVIAGAIGALAVAVILPNSVMLTTVILVASVLMNVGLSAWQFLIQIAGRSSDASDSRMAE